MVPAQSLARTPASITLHSVSEELYRTGTAYGKFGKLAASARVAGRRCVPACARMLQIISPVLSREVPVAAGVCRRPGSKPSARLSDIPKDYHPVPTPDARLTRFSSTLADMEVITELRYTLTISKSLDLDLYYM